MKRKNKTRNRILALALAAVLCTSGLITGNSLTAQAADAEIQTGLPAITVSTTTTTNPTVIGFGGKEWVVIGYDAAGVNSETGTMTLLLKKGTDSTDNSYGTTQFDSNGTSNVYSNSTIHFAMQTAASILSLEEQALIVPVDLAGDSTNEDTPGYLPNNVAGTAVTNQLFWPLSVTEANAIHANERIFSDHWWLRSAGDLDHNAAIVWGAGNVIPDGYLVDLDYGVRPALKINLTSVIFSSSAASGGKPASVGANLSVAKPPTAEIKLTLEDSSQALNVIATTDQQTQNASTLSFSYDSATTGTKQWVSCVLEQGGIVKYYGKLANSSSAATGTLDIPITGVANGNYKLHIFSEQDNGDNKTDLASIPVDMTVVVSSGSGTVSNFSGTALKAPTINLSAAGSTSRTVTLGYSDPVNIDFTVDGAPAPNFTITSDGGTGASLSGNRLTIPTGIAVGDYVIELTAANSQGTAAHTVNFKVTDIPITYYNIEVNAGTGGTVTGGETYAENDTATVVATPNTGWKFTQWTENGAEVNQSASYSFTVTADRTLTAEFEQGNTPPPPIVGSGRSSSSGGSSKADVSPVIGRIFTKPEATKRFAASLAAKPEGQTTLSFRARNYTSADKAAFAELAALAQKNGVTLTVHFDTVVGKAVTYRMSVNPALITTSLDLTAKIVGGKITLPKFSPAVEVAVKMPAGITMEILKITQNGKDIADTAKPWLDKNGYLHFTTTGGEIVLGK